MHQRQFVLGTRRPGRPLVSVVWTIFALLLALSSEAQGEELGVLRVQVWGDGTVMDVSDRGVLSPYLMDGQPRKIGKNYTLKALAGPGYVFAGWTGDVESSEATVTFLMDASLVLQANFIRNPFSNLTGSYNGLFYEAGEARPQSSGSVTLLLTDRGRFTAKLQMGKKRYPFVGELGIDGRATNGVARAGTNALTVTLALDLETPAGQIVGLVGDGNWLADLKADRAVSTTPAPFAGKYTALLPASGLDTDSPSGDGYGVVSVTPSGLATFKGSLAEGTVLTQRAPLSADGYWPFYAALYGGQGSVLGWVLFGDDSATELTGRLRWIKPVMPTGRYYPAGFTNETTLVGSSYVPPVGASSRVIAMTNGIASFSGGNLSASFSNEVTLEANNRVSNVSANKLALTIAKPTGLFKGSVADPATGTKLSFKGVLLQNQGAGSGFFLDANQSGRVYLGP